LRHARTAARYRWTFSGIGVSRAPQRGHAFTSPVCK
jgi:hypothetical protein